MRLTPDIKLVAIVRPHNLRGIEVPDNVKVLTNIPKQEAMRIINDARFMVFRLLGVRCPADM